jgi:hypothetical protein
MLGAGRAGSKWKPRSESTRRQPVREARSGVGHNQLITALARRRTVFLDNPTRVCLFCLSSDGPFTSAEHVIPRSLGPATNDYVIPPGGVCDPCNNWLGSQVDAPFVDRFDIRLTRGLERLRGRKGSFPDIIDGRDATAKLDVELEGAKVTLYAANVDETEDGGLDIELRPTVRDPPDVIARTIRAMWKMALGAIWLADPERALSREWDHLRCGVLGYRFSGYLLQWPFTAIITRRMDVNINSEAPESPVAMSFVLGGVALAVPIAKGARIARDDVASAGWEVYTTESVPPTSVHLRLEPTEQAWVRR